MAFGYPSPEHIGILRRSLKHLVAMHAPSKSRPPIENRERSQKCVKDHGKMYRQLQPSKIVELENEADAHIAGSRSQDEHWIGQMGWKNYFSCMAACRYSFPSPAAVQFPTHHLSVHWIRQIMGLNLEVWDRYNWVGAEGCPLQTSPTLTP